MSLNPPGCLSHVYFLQIVGQTTGRILSMAYRDDLKWQNNFSNLTASFTGLIMILYTGIKPTWLSYYLSGNLQILRINYYIVASKLKDPICHSNECQIGSFSSKATIYY